MYVSGVVVVVTYIQQQYDIIHMIHTLIMYTYDIYEVENERGGGEDMSDRQVLIVCFCAEVFFCPRL